MSSSHDQYLRQLWPQIIFIRLENHDLSTHSRNRYFMFLSFQNGQESWNLIQFKFRIGKAIYRLIISRTFLLITVISIILTNYCTKHFEIWQLFALLKLKQRKSCQLQKYAFTKTSHIFWGENDKKRETFCR